MGTEDEGDILSDIRSSQETKEPSMYQVILLNDDYTSMEFVVLVLQQVFRKSSYEATEVMLKVHEQGSGIAGVYVKEVAESKIETVHRLARLNEFPLKCNMVQV
jgi:ATP-dependent Clp protease adaptor protein ClpS